MESRTLASGLVIMLVILPVCRGGKAALSAPGELLRCGRSLTLVDIM